MAYEYHEPVRAELLEKAIQLTVEDAARNPSLVATDLAKEAVDAVFCTCVTTAADAVVKGEAPVHAGLIAEVRRQAEQRGSERKSGSDKIVDQASEQPFPASDPPAWIWR